MFSFLVKRTVELALCWYDLSCNSLPTCNTFCAYVYLTLCTFIYIQFVVALSWLVYLSCNGDIKVISRHEYVVNINAFGYKTGPQTKESERPRLWNFHRGWPVILKILILAAYKHPLVTMKVFFCLLLILTKWWINLTWCKQSFQVSLIS